MNAPATIISFTEARRTKLEADLLHFCDRLTDAIGAIEYDVLLRNIPVCEIGTEPYSKACADFGKETQGIKDALAALRAKLEGKL